MVPEYLKELEIWLKENEIEWDDSIIRIEVDQQTDISTEISGRAPIGIYAQKELHEGDIICRIPKTAILSPKTCSISDMFDNFDIGGSIALSIAVMYEKSLGKDSKFYGYLQSLPEFEPGLPLMWMKNFINGAEKMRKIETALKTLQGTEIMHTLEEDVVLMEQDYYDIVLPFIRKNEQVFKKCEAYFSLENFFKISSVVASRCFAVDSYHDHAMVPFADIFNHRTCLENVHLESDDQDNGHGDLEDNIIDMRIVSGVKEKGSEVFNTYGDHSNSYLLMKYGFSDRDNPFDVVSISLEDVKKIALDKNLPNIEDKFTFWTSTASQIIESILVEESSAEISPTSGEFESESENSEASDLEMIIAEDNDNGSQENYFQLSLSEPIDLKLMCLVHLLLDVDSVGINQLKNSLDDESTFLKFREEFCGYICWPCKSMTRKEAALIRHILDLRKSKYVKTTSSEKNSNELLKEYPQCFAEIVREGELAILENSLDELNSIVYSD